MKEEEAKVSAVNNEAAVSPEQTNASGTVVLAYYPAESIEDAESMEDETEEREEEDMVKDTTEPVVKEAETEEPTESIDELDNEDAQRAGVIPMQDGIEMFHNPYTPHTPRG